MLTFPPVNRRAVGSKSANGNKLNRQLHAPGQSIEVVPVWVVWCVPCRSAFCEVAAAGSGDMVCPSDCRCLVGRDAGGEGEEGGEDGGSRVEHCLLMDVLTGITLGCIEVVDLG